MSTDIRTASLVDQLAGLVALDDDAVALAQALDPQLQALATLAEQCAYLSRISELTSDQADAVAIWFGLVGLEGWADASLARKRTVLSEMVEVYQRRGTLWAWDRIIGILEGTTAWDGGATEWDAGATIWDDDSGMITLTEWWEQTPTDPPYTYRINIDVQHAGLTLAGMRHLRQVLDAYVPDRAELLELSETFSETFPLVAAGWPTVGIYIEVLP